MDQIALFNSLNSCPVCDSTLLDLSPMDKVCPNKHVRFYFNSGNLINNHPITTVWMTDERT